MIAGQHYTAIVKMQNNGSTAWTSGSTFYLGSRNPTDNTTWGTGRVALNSNVAPGQSYVFSFDVTAPDPGMYSFQWQMVQPGTAGFGASTPNVSITVSPPHPSIAWTGLNDALSRADKTAVLNYFADSSKYDAIFTAMGDNMKLLASSMSGFAFIEIASNHASAVVNQTEPSGTVFQHYVTFIYKDRRWQIIDF